MSKFLITLEVEAASMDDALADLREVLMAAGVSSLMPIVAHQRANTHY